MEIAYYPIEGQEDLASFEHLSHKIGIITNITANSIEIDCEEGNEQYILNYKELFNFIDEYKIGDKIKVYYFSSDGEVENNIIEIDQEESIMLYEE